MGDSMVAEEPAHRALQPKTFYSIVLLVFVADQFTKIQITRYLTWDQSRPLLGRAVALTLTRNTGGAWGLLPHGNRIFMVFALAAAAALLFAYHRMSRIELPVGAAFALALGGALGNLVDRLRFGYVIDFFELRSIHFPVFNIADSAISLGILLLCLHFLRSTRAGQPADHAGSLAAGEGGRPAE